MRRRLDRRRGEEQVSTLQNGAPLREEKIWLMIGPINFSESRLRIRRERRQGRGVYYYYNNSHECIASP
jgi:hypothetical protein